MNEKNFNLSKVKLDPNGGLKAEYQITTVVDDEPSVITRKESCSRDVHPDLSDSFKALRQIVGSVFGFTQLLTELDTGEMSAGTKARLKAKIEDQLDKIEVRGIALSGSEEKAGVIITAILETANGTKTCINTPRIRLESDSFGFEEELQDCCEAIKTEVYQYLFEGKQAQLSLFGEQNDMPVA